MELYRKWFEVASKEHSCAIHFANFVPSSKVNITKSTPHNCLRRTPSFSTGIGEGMKFFCNIGSHQLASLIGKIETLQEI